MLVLYKFETYLNQLLPGVTDSQPKRIALGILNPSGQKDCYIKQSDMFIADAVVLLYRHQLRRHIENHGPWLNVLQECLPEMLENMTQDVMRYSSLPYAAVLPNLLDVKAKACEFANAYATYCAKNRRRQDPKIRTAIAQIVIGTYGDTLKSTLTTFREAWQYATVMNTDVSDVAVALPIDNPEPSRYDLEMTIRTVLNIPSSEKWTDGV